MTSVAGVGKVTDILEVACARNLPVELRRSATNGALQVAKTRLIGMDRWHLYLDSPESIGKPIHFTRGTVLAAYLAGEDKWYLFRSRVTQTNCQVKLHAGKTVIGMAITRPAKLTEGQGRDEYRVSLACVEPIVADLREASQADPDSGSLDAERFGGRLVDMSAGGLSLRVETPQGRDFRVNEVYFISYTLPDGEGEMTFLVELRHLHKIRDGEAARLGLKFLPWNWIQTQRNLQRTARFLAKLQRRSPQAGKS